MDALIDLNEDLNPKASFLGGRAAYPPERLLRDHLLQKWYSYIYTAVEDRLVEVPLIPSFTETKACLEQMQMLPKIC